MSIAARHHRWPSSLIVGLVVPLALVQAASADVTLRVDGHLGVPNGSGASWATAKKYLTDALDEAYNNATDLNRYEIWVAAAPNAYRPDQSAASQGGTDDPASSFVLPMFTKVYGGCHGNPGGEDQLAQRDYVANPTVLSGEIASPEDADNTYHVVYALDVDNSAVLDGFTIVDGYSADLSGVGGGILICTTDTARPGPVIARCRVADNFADYWGGGAHVWGAGADPTFLNCSFVANVAGGIFTVGAGGGVSWAGTGPNTEATLVNCLFVGNAADFGGAIATGDEGDIINCTFVNNLGAEGEPEAIYVQGAGNLVTNSILWGGPGQIAVAGDPTFYNVTVSYSDVDGGLPAVPGVLDGGGNINADPRFVNLSAGDYRLSKPCSPCVDAGHPGDGGSVNSSCIVLAGYSVPCAQACPSPGSGILCDTWNVDQDASITEPTPDLRHPTVANSAPRVLDGEGDAANDDRIDMGAYEFVRACCPWDCQMNHPADGRVGTDDLNTLLTQWGQTCTTCDFGAGPDGVGTEDRDALLAHWGNCGCAIAVPVNAAGSESELIELSLEEALAIMGFDGVDAYITWGQQATEAEVYASTVLLLAIFGY